MNMYKKKKRVQIVYSLAKFSMKFEAFILKIKLNQPKVK